MKVKEFIKIEMAIPNNKELLNDLQYMIKECDLFLSSSDKCLTTLDVTRCNIFGRCVNIELKCSIHDDIIIILTVIPTQYIEWTNPWVALLDAGVLFEYKICYDKDGIISHIQLVKGKNEWQK